MQHSREGLWPALVQAYLSGLRSLRFAHQPTPIWGCSAPGEAMASRVSRLTHFPDASCCSGIQHKSPPQCVLGEVQGNFSTNQMFDQVQFHWGQSHFAGYSFGFLLSMPFLEPVNPPGWSPPLHDLNRVLVVQVHPLMSRPAVEQRIVEASSKKKPRKTQGFDKHQQRKKKAIRTSKPEARGANRLILAD